jgi:hypothetical protein
MISLETCDFSVRDLMMLMEQEEAIFLTKNGQPQYVLGNIDEFEWEVLALSRNQRFMDYLAQARRQAKIEGTLSLAEVRQRLNIPSTS